MKKFISLLLTALLLTTIFTALPLSASAATEDSAAVGDRPFPDMPGGDFGTCSWSFDIINGTLTISGTGSTGDYNLLTEKPWAQYLDEIVSIVVMQGVTTLGQAVFADTPHLETVSLAPSVTTVSREAFYKCNALTDVTLPDTIASIGVGAFVSSGLNAFTIPNPSCQLETQAIGYAPGKNYQTMPKSDFTIYGYGSNSTARTYAVNNGFTYIDLTAQAHPVSVEQGSAYSVATGERVTSARAGERLRCAADRMQSFKIFQDFYTYNDNVTLDETDWSFTMPDEEVSIYMHTEDAWSMNIDMSEGTGTIGQQNYDYLVSCINSGVLQGEPKSGTTDEYYISFPDDAYVLLTPTGVYSYDFDYAPCYCLELPNGYQYNPININFAANHIHDGTLDLTVPAAGSPWDYDTMQATIVPGNEDWNVGRFTVDSAVWYNHWGISAFDTFEGGEQYFVGFTLVPTDGYYFTRKTIMRIRVAGYDQTISLTPLYLNIDGSACYSAGQTWDQIRIIGGDPHTISIANAKASYPGAADTVITQAIPGQEVYVRVNPYAIDNGEYLVMGSVNVTSDDTEIDPLDLVDVWCFYMPNHDVTGVLTCETREQVDSVLPLYSGEVTVPYDGTQVCENYGVECLMNMKIPDREYDSETGVSKYDIDGNGSWDIQRRDSNKYSLLPTNSLTENVTITTTREENYRFPVRNITLQVHQVVRHNITVIGGVASSEEDDYFNQHVITQAYPGETVYVVPRSGDVDDDSYIAQFSQSATGNDVTIYDEAGISFVMPDHDVTVNYNYDCYVQDISILDFRYEDTVTITDDGTGVRSEVYGTSMVFRLMAVTNQEVSDDVTRYDIDGDGSFDIEQNTATNTYTLLATHSLPENGMNLILSREQSWTLPIREVVIMVPQVIVPDKHGDVDGDGTVTINDATLLQRFLAEFTAANGDPLLDLNDPAVFFRADANNDGKVNVKDVTAIQRYVAGLEDLPA